MSINLITRVKIEMKDKKRINMYLPDELYQQIKVMSIQNKHTFTDEVIHHLKAVATPAVVETPRERTPEELKVITLVRDYTVKEAKLSISIIRHCVGNGIDERFCGKAMYNFSRDNIDREFDVKKGVGGAWYKAIVHEKT